jgi:protein-L-isoaspartate O-methyltransferase
MFSNPYVAVCLALIVGPKGFVVTEGDDETVDQVRKNYNGLIESERLIFVDGKWSDFLAKGWSVRAPYDVIIVPKHYYSRGVELQLEANGTAYDPWDDSRLNDEDRTRF